HPGIYIVVASGICLLVIYRRYWKQFLISLSLPIGFVYIIFPYLLFPMLHVVPAGSQDVFGPMLSQTARVLRDHPDALNSEERETLHKVVPYRVMATGYSTASTDYVKGNFRQDSSLSERLDYLALWARQGFRYPIEYFEAFFTIQSAWFSPDRGWDIFDNLYPGTAQHVVDLVGHNNRLPFNKAKQVRQQLYFDGPVQLYPAKQFMRYTFHHLHEAPVVGILFAKPLYTFYLPFIVFAVVLINKRRFLPAFIPAIFSFGVLLISPMDMSRYALPLLEATPLFLGLAILSLMYPQKYLQNSKHPKRYDRIVAEDTEPAIPEDGHA
ncbi:MAG: DUF6020 family protein, partial [Coriobacteriales bacterium]|nr:DUF6020 family protein [Coriobacteriales bacterium]